MTGFALSPNFFLLASKRLWTAGQSALRSRGTVWKSDTPVTFHNKFNCGKKNKCGTFLNRLRNSFTAITS
jgi:hypothetical protein